MIILAGICCSLLTPACHGGPPDATDDLNGLTATEIFQRRILPILKSDKASSCTECHFGGVELKNYIHEDQATTFATLRANKLIDVQAPDKSKLLTFIARRPDAPDELLARVRQSEYRAFQAWIRAAVREPELLAARQNGTTLGTELPVEVVRHMRRDHVLQSFVENIWSEEPLLSAGRYLARIYIDREGKTTQNRDYEMSESDLYGQVEFTGPWQPGYQPPKIIHAPASR